MFSLKAGKNRENRYKSNFVNTNNDITMLSSHMPMANMMLSVCTNM